MWVCSDVFKPCFLCVLHALWLLHSFHCLVQKFPERTRDRVEEDISFSIKCSKVFQLLCNIWIGICIFFPIFWRKIVFSWWLGKTQSYQFIRMTLRVILLLLSLNRTVVFCFPLRPQTTQSKLCGHSHWLVFKSNHIDLLSLQTLCQDFTSCRWVTIVDWRILGLLFTFLLW